MLKTTENQSYDVISICFDINSSTICTTICETNGKKIFDFKASFELNLEQETSSLIKKMRQYAFSKEEFIEAKKQLFKTAKSSINSILNETSTNLLDIDYIVLENIHLHDDLEIDISADLQKEFNLNIIKGISYNKQTYENYLDTLANDYTENPSVIIQLDNIFTISYFKHNVSIADYSVGFNLLDQIASYYNIDSNSAIAIASQGEFKQSIIDKIKEIEPTENLQKLQKAIYEIIIYSNLNAEDALFNAINIINKALLMKLSLLKQFDDIILIGQTDRIKYIEAELAEIYPSIIILDNATERQNSLHNEVLTYTSVNKFTGIDNNNGVKIS